MSLRALIFDVDGTLADTEEIHRQAFNQAFREHGLEWEWSPERYARLLEVTGGKERIRHFVAGLDLVAEERTEVEAIVHEIHATKTHHFTARIASGSIALRPGVSRLIAEARAAGIQLGIATTTSPENVRALVAHAFGGDALSWFGVLACGDDVVRKKPDPDIYRYALARLGEAPENCVAFEDSVPGVRAAVAAELLTVATPTQWTREQDLSEADLVLPSLGDPQAPLPPHSRAPLGGASWLGLKELAALLQAARVPGRSSIGSSDGHGDGSVACTSSLGAVVRC